MSAAIHEFPVDSEVTQFWRDVETCRRVEPNIAIELLHSLIRRKLMKEFVGLPDTEQVARQWDYHAKAIVETAVAYGHIPEGTKAPTFPWAEVDVVVDLNIVGQASYRGRRS